MRFEAEAKTTKKGGGARLSRRPGRKQLATLEFVDRLPGRKLQGSLFVFESITAKDIRHFSSFPNEEEVLFAPNSQFQVESVLASEADKKAALEQLTAYDMTELDVYVLKQIA